MYGHVNTVLPVAIAAQHAGHDVVVATGPDLVDLVAARGLAVWSIGPSIAAAGGRAAITPDWFVTTGDQRATDLLARLGDWCPDVVVREEMELGGAVATAATGAAHVVHGLGFVPPDAILDLFDRAVDAACAGRGLASGPVQSATTTYVTLAPPSLQPPPDRRWRALRNVRPALGRPAPGETLPPPLQSFLDAPGEPVVHVTLGTVFHESPGVLAAAVAGAAALAVRVVVTTGPGVEPDDLPPQPPHVRVERYVPHALLLPYCRAVVSQGGAGIMFGAMAHGLAQVVVPQAADQFHNAATAEGAGAAIALQPPDVSAPAVAEALGRVLAEPSWAHRARALALEIAAMPAVEDVLADLVAPSRRPSGCVVGL